MSDSGQKKEGVIEKNEAQIERKTVEQEEGKMVPEREYRAVVQVPPNIPIIFLIIFFIIFQSSTCSSNFVCHSHTCSAQDLELLLSHREEIEKIQNFVAELQSAGLQGRIL